MFAKNQTLVGERVDRFGRVDAQFTAPYAPSSRCFLRRDRLPRRAHGGVVADVDRRGFGCLWCWAGYTTESSGSS